MKTLLRTSALAASLALSAFAMRGSAITSSGTCRTTCSDPSTFTFTQVYWQSTEAQCCGRTFNPCPPGTNPTVYAFYPSSGFAKLCGPANG